MAKSADYKFVDNSWKFVGKVEDGMERALVSMISDVEKLAKTTVPVDASPLKNSIRPVKIAKHKHALIANKEYAAYQEFGGDGRRTVRNYTKPGTGPGFLRNSGDKIKSRAAEYFRRYKVKSL